jgi:Arc/MetJ-type ribon-helix-helix transcriptional regulator
MSISFTVRLDDETEHKLTDLTSDGSSRNSVIRYALDLAYRAMLNEQMRRESAALLEDAEDLTEINAAREAMGAGNAW